MNENSCNVVKREWKRAVAGLQSANHGCAGYGGTRTG